MSKIVEFEQNFAENKKQYVSKRNLKLLCKQKGGCGDGSDGGNGGGVDEGGCDGGGDAGGGGGGDAGSEDSDPNDLFVTISTLSSKCNSINGDK